MGMAQIYFKYLLLCNENDVVPRLSTRLCLSPIVRLSGNLFVITYVLLPTLLGERWVSVYSMLRP